MLAALVRGAGPVKAAGVLEAVAVALSSEEVSGVQNDEMVEEVFLLVRDILAACEGNGGWVFFCLCLRTSKGALYAREGCNIVTSRSDFNFLPTHTYTHIRTRAHTHTHTHTCAHTRRSIIPADMTTRCQPLLATRLDFHSSRLSSMRGHSQAKSRGSSARPLLSWPNDKERTRLGCESSFCLSTSRV